MPTAQLMLECCITSTIKGWFLASFLPLSSSFSTLS